MEIIIHQAILHVLDTTLDAPVLSGSCMEPTAEKMAYLQYHIEKLLASDDIRQCRPLPDSAFRNELEQNKDFVDLSCRIAGVLFDYMHAHTTIPGADLFLPDQALRVRGPGRSGKGARLCDVAARHAAKQPACTLLQQRCAGQTACLRDRPTGGADGSLRPLDLCPSVRPCRKDDLAGICSPPLCARHPAGAAEADGGSTGPDDCSGDERGTLADCRRGAADLYHLRERGRQRLAHRQARRPRADEF